MLTKNLFYQLVALLIFISVGCVNSQEIPSEENNAIIVDTIDNSENLLDSNLSYKKQFDSLSKDGDWVEVKKSDFLRDISEETGEDLWEQYPFGDEVMYLWRPYCANQYWNPYTNGRWEFTYYGWVWNSYYSWGWGPYNYGRWHYSKYYGWIWIPGRSWAANWVSWRCHDNYIGWYPTCPVVHWTVRQAHYTNRKFAYKPLNWQFVTKTNFTKKIDNTTLVSAGNNSEILKKSTKIKNSVYIDPSLPKIKYNGPDVNEISKETGEKIQPKNIRINESGQKEYTDDSRISVNKKDGNMNVKSNNSGTVPIEKNPNINTSKKKIYNRKEDGKKYEGTFEPNGDRKSTKGNEENRENKTNEESKKNDKNKDNEESKSGDTENSKTGRAK